VEAVGGQQVQPGNTADERARQDSPSQAHQGTFRLGANPSTPHVCVFFFNFLVIFFLSCYISYGFKLLMQKKVLIKTSVNFLCLEGFDSKQDPDQPNHFFS
jgi:hypothetical protein